MERAEGQAGIEIQEQWSLICSPYDEYKRVKKQ